MVLYCRVVLRYLFTFGKLIFRVVLYVEVFWNLIGKACPTWISSLTPMSVTVVNIHRSWKNAPSLVFSVCLLLWASESYINVKFKARICWRIHPNEQHWIYFHKPKLQLNTLGGSVRRSNATFCFVMEGGGLCHTFVFSTVSPSRSLGLVKPSKGGQLWAG